MTDPWENEDGSTNVEGFLAAYAEDDNTFWRAAQGHIMNVLDDAIDRLETATRHRDAWRADAKQLAGAVVKHIARYGVLYDPDLRTALDDHAAVEADQ
jgi:hypothetical protein